MISSEQLFDILARKQFYIEGVKTEMAADFAEVARSLSVELRRIIYAVPYESLSEMSKLETQVLMKAINETADDHYDEWLKLMLQLLEAFSDVDYKMSQQIFASADEDRDTLGGLAWALGVLPSLPKPETIWSRTQAAPMLATGVTLGAFLRGFVTAAKAQVRAEVQKGVAGAETPAEVVKALTAPDTGPGTAGIVTKQPNQVKAVLDTILRHTSQQAQKEVSKTVSDSYQWISVIDARTTDYCLEHNGKVYKNGQGPLPPAHINCRSDVMPVVGKPFDVNAFDLYTWTRNQSEAVLRDFFGPDLWEGVKNGTVTQEQINRLLRQVPGISVTEYQNRAKRIYTGT